MIKFKDIISEVRRGKFSFMTMGFSSPNGGGIIKGDAVSILNTYEALRKQEGFRTFKVGLAVKGEVSAISYMLKKKELRTVVKEMNKYLDEKWGCEVK